MFNLVRVEQTENYNRIFCRFIFLNFHKTQIKKIIKKDGEKTRF